MDDPIKIIFKFKNNHRRIQHHTYIFVGDIPSNILTILNKIKELSLYDTWITLNNNEYRKIENYYGEEWYKKFFNTYHLNFTIYTVLRSKQQEKELVDKFGKDWYSKHIESHKLIEKKIFYSYEALIKTEKMRKEFRKKKLPVNEEEEDINYRTKSKEGLKDMIESFQLRRSGRSGRTETDSSDKESSDIRGLVGSGIGSSEANSLSESYSTPSEYDDDDDIDVFDFAHAIHKFGDRYQEGGTDVYPEGEPGYPYTEIADEDNDGVVEFEEGVEYDELQDDEDFDLEEIEKVYQDVQVDENVAKTSELIKKALKDDKIFKKTKSKLVEFDISKDDYMYDEQLKNLYTKYYVTNQYIFKDDTIKMIKNKICCGFRNNPKFSDTNYILPSRQYLWSEYYYDEKVEKVMVGQKWVKRTDLLTIDVEPNSNIRVYEELRKNLKLLRDNIKRYGSKIKWENDDNNILFDYDNYFTNNELFMIDVYNELGKGYSPDQEALQNVSDVFFRIYFPRVQQENIKHIISYLNGDTQVEDNRISGIYQSINNDLLLENQIMKNVEDVKKDKSYKSIFKENYITQSVIHVNLRLDDQTKINLFRIFNEFIVSEKYPFIQYQTIDGQIIFKYSQKDIIEYSRKKDNVDVLSKWFENAPYGISFKVRITERGIEKFMAINLNENGRIEYKTQWKEEDMATIDDIRNTYNYVKELIKKINSERNKTTIQIPEDEEFKYAFINTIQKFELPEKFIINHNDLSEFSRYFYPYVALVIEPRKRLSKVRKGAEKSKFGTYLRYKRVSKYENQARIEQRILYFMRNYDYNDQSLSNEISKQFNITVEKAMESIESVRSKYPNIKRSRKILKKLENIPKYKPPGIGIDVQGKQRDKYKIRISGARNKDQLDRIINFMNILIYLYVETYLYKKPERQALKDKLKNLTKIAHRRNKVDEIVDYEKDVKSVKQMTKLDKKRIGFKPEKGQSQWTRSCQNSGTDKRRQPQQHTSAHDLRSLGFSLDKKTGIYEKKVKLKGKKGKQKEVVIRAAGLEGMDEEGNPTGQIYYSCNPDDNGEHMFVGFLSRSHNPYGQCMPCCFKKDPMVSKNKEKRDYFLRCIGKMEKKEKPATKIVGDKLYILQDTNKIQEGRFGFLPKYLDFFMNRLLNNTRKIKHHYLLTSKTGYFFKFGTRQDEHQFLNAVGSIFSLTVSDLKEKLIEKMESDKSDTLFTALNNGDIKTRFKDRSSFIDFIKTSNNLDFDLFNHFLSIPGVLDPKGLNIVVFQKMTITIKKTLEKEKMRDDFVIMCQNPEESDNIRDETRDTVFIIREFRNFYPIVKVTKKDEASKKVDITKVFNYEKKEGNIINHIMEFYKRNCESDIYKEITYQTKSLTAKELYDILNKTGQKDYQPRFQVIDARNKCKYIITQNSTIIPTKPSGSIYNLTINKNMANKLLSLKDTLNNLEKIYNLSKKEIPVKPVGFYYDTKTDKKAKVIGIMTESDDVVPIKEEEVDVKWIESKGMAMEHKQLYDKIDEEIQKGEDNFKIDERIIDVNEKKYMDESYNLFRLEFSEYINKPTNEKFRKRIERIINNNKMDKKDKQVAIRKILYRLIDQNLFETYEKILQQEGGVDTLDRLIETQSGGKYEKFVHMINNLPDLRNYSISNNRDVCPIHKSRDQCNNNPHCRWAYDNCYFAITKEMAVKFVNRISQELSTNQLKSSELLKREDYFVSDIVDYNRFTERDGQKIIKSTNYAINKVLRELFGNENVPIIGKRRGLKLQDIDIQQMNIDNPIKDMGEFYIQKIIENNLTIFRAYSNSFFWVKQKFYDLDSRNLGYYTNLQTNLANFFKSTIIDWLLDKNNQEVAEKEIIDYIEIGKKRDLIQEFIVLLGRDINTSTNCVVELYVLNKIYNIPIYVYNDNNELLYLFDGKLIYDMEKEGSNVYTKSKFDKYRDIEMLRSSINIKFSLLGGSDIPIEIDVIYYK